MGGPLLTEVTSAALAGGGVVTAGVSEELVESETLDRGAAPSLVVTTSGVLVVSGDGGGAGTCEEVISEVTTEGSITAVFSV